MRREKLDLGGKRNMGKESVDLGGGEGNLEDWKSDLGGGQKLSWEGGKVTLGVGYNWSELKKEKSKWSVLNKRKGIHWGDQQQDCLLERINKIDMNTVLTC